MNTFIFKATFIEATYFHYRKDKTTQTKQKTPKKPQKHSVSPKTINFNLTH